MTGVEYRWASEAGVHSMPHPDELRWLGVLILAPLCVGEQTIAEGQRIGVDVRALNSGGRSGGRIEITNYERLHHINPSDYAGVVLDESSILKAYDGKTRTRLIRAFADVPYRLCCTATPARAETDIHAQARLL